MRARVARWMSAAPARLAGLAAQGPHRGWLRRRSRDLGSSRRIGRRSAAASPTPQADAVRRPHAPRRRHDDLPSRRAGVGRWRAGDTRKRTTAMTDSFVELSILASERLGAAAVDCNDEFFAAKDNLVKPSAPEWREGAYTDRGKWMDGWETRRRRDVTPESHDWCVVRLGVRGVVKGVDVETTHFKGNFPESCALDVGDGTSWREVLARTRARGQHAQPFCCSGSRLTPRTCGCESFPTAASRGCACTATVVADWDRLRTARRRRSRCGRTRRPRRRHAATCFSDRATT